MFDTPADYYWKVRQANEDAREIDSGRIDQERPAAKGYRPIQLDLVTFNEIDVATVVSRRHSYTLVLRNGGEYTAPKNSHDGDAIRRWLDS